MFKVGDQLLIVRFGSTSFNLWLTNCNSWTWNFLFKVGVQKQKSRKFVEFEISKLSIQFVLFKKKLKSEIENLWCHLCWDMNLHVESCIHMLRHEFTCWQVGYLLRSIYDCHFSICFISLLSDLGAQILICG